MDCLFCKINKREISADIIYDDSEVLAFRDINAQAPTHVLVIPKKHIATIDDANAADAALLGKLVLVAQKIARDLGLADNGYRLVFNVKDYGGQEIYHIHLHILGGRQMAWPPG